MNEFSPNNSVAYVTVRNVRGVEDIARRLHLLSEVDSELVVHYKGAYTPIGAVVENLSKNEVEDVEPFILKNELGDERKAAVVRFYGGLGDLVDMQPCLVKLAAKYSELFLFVPERYHFLFSSVENIVCFDHNCKNEFGSNLKTFKSIYPDIYSECGTIYDAFCPAARYEMQTSHRPKLSRAEVFAKFFDVDFQPTSIDFSSLSSIELPSPVVGFNLFSMNRSKDWELQKVREVCSRLYDRGVNVITLDRDVGISEACSYVDMNLSELCGIISKLDCMVTTDTGPLHVACAAGVKTVALFGPTNGNLIKKHYDNVELIQVNRDDKCFRPCYFNTFNGYRCQNCIGDCMEDISVDSVFNAVLSML